MVNMTEIVKNFVSWWQSVDSFIPKVETLLILSTILFGVQVVFGWLRRCSSSPFIKYPLWVAYTCTPLVATYTLGFLSTFTNWGRYKNASDLEKKSFDLDTRLYRFYWSISLVFGISTTYSMTAYDVDDNKQYMRHVVRNALYVLNMFGVTRFFLQDEVSLLLRVLLLLLLLAPVSLFSTITNIRACSYPDNGSLYLQEYMNKENRESTSYDPVTLEGYNYLILFNLGPKCKDVTVSQVWLSNRGLLGRSGSHSTRLKEVCLSFALSHLLKRRFFGGACPEAKLQKTHDLVFQGLLSNVEANYPSAYRVIETELAFIHDHFFITTPNFGCLIIGFAIAKAALFILVSIRFNLSSTSSMNKDCTIVTTIVMLVLSALELLQIYILLSSDFVKVVVASWLFIFTNPLKCDIWFQFWRVCNKLPQLFGCWQNKIGQHSILKDLHKRSITTDVIGSLHWITIGRLGHLAFPRGICNPGVKGADHKSLTNGVKKAIALTLKLGDGRLSNGTSSLERNGQVQLSQEFLLGSHAGDLLIWHIATEYCDMAQYLQAVRHDDYTLSNRDVAARLSSYCAYLMAFVPELLPDDQLETLAMFHRARKEALKHLQGEKTLRAKYTKLRNYGQPPPQNGHMNDGQLPQENDSMNDGQPTPQNGNIQDVNVFEMGIQLGKRLEGIPDTGTRWKILADFWTEMILYIAPSNNVRDHIQHLANGGEFITHLWALLTHAGILDREERNNVTNDTENPGDGPSSHTYSGTFTTCTAAPSTWDTNQPPTTSNPTVQRTERDVRETRDSGTYHSDPRELSYGAALRLRHASSYLDKCAEGAGSAAYRTTNEPAMRGTNCAKMEMVVHQTANPVQNGARARNESNGLSEIEETAE